MITQITKVLVAVAMLALSTAGVAGIAYDNGLPDQQSGGTVNNGQSTADDFVLGQATTLTSGQFWTLEQGDGSQWDGTLLWGVLADNGNVPGALVTSGAGVNVVKTEVQTGISLGQFVLTEFVYTFEFAGGLNLAAGDYWLALFLQTFGGPQQPLIFWESTGDFQVTGDPSVTTTQAPNWFALDWDLAFVLYDDTVPVPVPSPLLLVLPLALMLVRKNRHALKVA